MYQHSRCRIPSSLPTTSIALLLIIAFFAANFIPRSKFNMYPPLAMLTHLRGKLTLARGVKHLMPVPKGLSVNYHITRQCNYSCGFWDPIQ